jgi:hypothetical protein
VTDTGAGWLPAALVLTAAVLVAWRKRRRRSAPPRTRPRRGAALLVVVALVGGSSLLGTPAYAQPFDCKESPEPDRPGTGLVGSLDGATFGVGEPGSVYDEVGYAGLIWYTYDLGCAGQAVFNPATTTDTWMGNQALNVAKFGVGGVNWAHYLIADGGKVLDPLDNLISQGTRAMYTAVFTTWIGPALAILAAVLLILALRGDLARQTQRAAFAVAALVIGSAAYLAPIDWAKAADPLLLDGVTTMQEGFLGPVGLGDRDTLPTVLVDQAIYQNWLRGEFGGPEVPEAQQYGRDLLRAQAFTKAEIKAAVAENKPTADLAQKKKADFAAIAGKLGDRYPYFQGKSGSRVGAGALALVEAACIALFQLLSKVLVLVAMLMLRLLVMTAPAVAVVAVLKPDILPSLLRVAGAAIVNTLVVGALAGLHALLVVSLFRPGSGIDLWLALLVTGVVTVVLWAVARPFRRLVSMVSLTREQFGGIVPGAGTGPMSRVWTRMRGGEAEDKQARWWEERAGAMAGRDAGGERVRPETESVARVWATATRVTRARPEIETPGGAVAVPGARRPAAALPSGTVRSTWSEPAEVDDRTIYRRPDAVSRRPGAREVQPEIVDGVPVYRIYRPMRSAPRGAG